MTSDLLGPEAAELVGRRFRALADPTRLRILDFLRREGESSVGAIAAAVDGSQQNVSKHLGVLYVEGFLARRKHGTSSLYRVADPSAVRLCEIVIGGIGAQLSGQLGAIG